MGSVAPVNATRLATSSIDNRVFNGVTPVQISGVMVYRILSTICPFQGAAARYPSVSRTRAANWRNKAPESKKSRALPRFGLPSTVERPACGADRRQPSAVFVEDRALFCRAREAIMRDPLMTALATFDPSSLSV